jgi:hypothetical protein
MVAQLKQERQGKHYAAATPMTPGQLKIRELEKRITPHSVMISSRSRYETPYLNVKKHSLKYHFTGIVGSFEIDHYDFLNI